LDPSPYPEGVKVSDEAFAAIRLTRDDFHGEWKRRHHAKQCVKLHLIFLCILIHSCCYRNQQPFLGQISIGRVGRFSISANTKRIRKPIPSAFGGCETASRSGVSDCGTNGSMGSRSEILIGGCLFCEC
jgi:hypothetical protein